MLYFWMKGEDVGARDILHKIEEIYTQWVPSEKT